jgi:hypothetical protein
LIGRTEDEMTMKTIDERIRERAQQDLHNALDSAFAPIRRLSSSHNIFVAGLKDENGNGVTISSVIASLFSSLYADHCQWVEEKAITEFLAKIDGIQYQVDELRESVSTH